MRISQIIRELGGVTRTRLAEMGSDRIGATAQWGSCETELRDYGLIGPEGGLTVRGSAVACVLREERETELFG